MDRQPLISIVVPVYNVVDYLGACLDSILNQSYKNLEIVLVDDGSTDGSGEICDEYAKQNDNIRVIHQENGGLSVARNVGLDVIAGEFVTFVDLLSKTQKKIDEAGSSLESATKKSQTIQKKLDKFVGVEYEENDKKLISNSDE